MDFDMSKELTSLKSFVAVIVASGLLLFSTLMQAQTYDDPSIGEKPISAHPQDFKPLGVRAGSFMLHPGIELATQWHDNIFYTYDNQISDTIFHIRPYITAQSNWSKHSLTIYLGADFAFYDKYGFRDYEDYFFTLGGTVDVRSRSYFSYGVEYLDLHEERNARNAEQGIEPTRYNATGGYLGYDHTFNRLSVGLEYRLRMLDYENTIGFDGEVIDNQDRNRDQSLAGLRLGYQFQTDKQAFVSLNWNETDYDQYYDRSGYHRDSSGYNLSAGLAFQITAVLDGDVYVTYHDREYDDPTLPSVNGWAAGAGLHWFPTQLTSVHGQISSSVEDTTQSTSSGYLRTLYRLRVDHELLRDLQLTANLSYNTNDYTLLHTAPQGTRSEDKIWRAGIGVNYFFNRYVRLTATYDYSKLSSNLPMDGYEANQFWLVLGLER